MLEQIASYRLDLDGLRAQRGRYGRLGAADSTTAATIAFRTVAPKLEMLTEAERALLSQWLDRATDK